MVKKKKFIYFLKRTLALTTSQDKLHRWDKMIDHCLYVYRTTFNRTLKTSPFQIIYGRKDIMPQDLVYKVNNNNETIIDRDKYQFELNKKLSQMYEDVYKNRLEEQMK
jgi:hypothetical protein